MTDAAFTELENEQAAESIQIVNGNRKKAADKLREQINHLRNWDMHSSWFSEVSPYYERQLRIADAIESGAIG